MSLAAAEKPLAGGDLATGCRWRLFDTANEFGSAPAAGPGGSAASAHACILTWDKKKKREREFALVRQPCANLIILHCEVIEEKDSRKGKPGDSYCHG